MEFDVVVVKDGLLNSQGLNLFSELGVRGQDCTEMDCDLGRVNDAVQDSGDQLPVKQHTSGLTHTAHPALKRPLLNTEYSPPSQ